MRYSFLISIWAGCRADMGINMIIIEGVPGVGKTTLQKCICRIVERSFMLMQDYEHNICLSDFYKGEPCILQKQMIILFSDYHLLVSSINKHPGDIIISDYSIERSKVMAEENLSSYEYEHLFLPCYNYLIEKLPKHPKMLILLYASPEYIMANIRKRNRSMERQITEQYIDEKQALIMKELPKYKFDQIITFKCDNNDISSENFIKELVQKIRHFENEHC